MTPSRPHHAPRPLPRSPRSARPAATRRTQVNLGRDRGHLRHGRRPQVPDPDLAHPATRGARGPGLPARAARRAPTLPPTRSGSRVFMRVENDTDEPHRWPPRVRRSPTRRRTRSSRSSSTPRPTSSATQPSRAGAGLALPAARHRPRRTTRSRAALLLFKITPSRSTTARSSSDREPDAAAQSAVDRPRRLAAQRARARRARPARRSSPPAPWPTSMTATATCGLRAGA